MQHTPDILLAVLFFVILVLVAPRLGCWLASVLEGRGGWTSWLTGNAGEVVMNWRQYAGAVVVFNVLGFIVLLLLQLAQGWLPLNSQKLPGLSVPLALNTAISFVTNTNWQAYSGEAVMSYLTQMLGLGVQNFLSAATGISVLLAVARGLSGKPMGNFWCDLVRSTLLVLLPMSLLLALVLASQGVVQSFDEYVKATTLEGAEQVIPLGPAASQVAIKQLGTNGGGFFGVNSAHPFENPTSVSNFLQLLAILLLPAALVFAYGRIIGRPSDAWAIFITMLLMLVAAFAVMWTSDVSLSHPLEGKETRFGVMSSTLWAAATTAASNGSVNAMHSSLSPLAGLVAMFQIMLGEIVLGGVGSGMYGMLLYVLLTVFLAGLMVGRTPEYLGRRVESGEIAWAVVGILLPSALMLAGAALSCLTEAGRASLLHGGPHGLSEVLYAWASAAGNNGSSFAGMNANTHWYHFGLGLAMLLGRFGVIIPVLAVAGRMMRKRSSPPSPGTFPTHGPAFILLLLAVILVVGGLTFLPALTLGPVLEHFLLIEGRAL